MQKNVYLKLFSQVLLQWHSHEVVSKVYSILFWDITMLLLLFPEIRVTKKILTRLAENLFFLINFPEIFSFLIEFLLLFCILGFFASLFVFLKLKMYILVHLWLCDQVSDKKIFARRISGSKTTFFGLTLKKRHRPYSYKWIRRIKIKRQ